MVTRSVTRRRRPSTLFAALAVLSTVLMVLPAGATDTDNTVHSLQEAASSFDGVEPRHASPGGCTIGAFLWPTRVTIRRGDTNEIIGTFDLPGPITANFSLGDTIVVNKMELTNDGCDFDNAGLDVAIYQAFSGAPGTSTDSQVVSFSESMANGGIKTFSGVNFSHVTISADVDAGGISPPDPAGDQIAILGIVDIGHDPGVDLHDVNKCGVQGTLHNGDIDGNGCSVTLTRLTLSDPEITVKKRAFIWNGKLPKVFLDGGVVKINGKFLKDGKSVVKPGKKVHYLYEVFNPGPIKDLTTLVQATDSNCGPLAQVFNGPQILGDNDGDGEVDTGEAWYWLCDKKLKANLGPALPFKVVQNTATFELEDRNGNPTGEVTDDFSLFVGYKCFGKLATIVGTPGNDIIDGTAGNDVIVSLGGDDTVDGKDGNDRICLGKGDDEGYGGGGKDKIAGQGGNDIMEGGGGDDVLKGGPGFDTADGGAGKDKCVAEIKTNCEL